MKKQRFEFRTLLALVLAITIILLPFDTLALTGQAVTSENMATSEYAATPDEAEPSNTESIENTEPTTRTKADLSPVGSEESEENVIAQVVHADQSTTPYTTVQEAINGADVGETVQLLCDVPVTATLTISKNLTFDLNGYGLISSGVTVFYAESKTWTLMDSSPERSTHYYTVDETGLAHVSDNPDGADGSFTGGYLTGTSSGDVYNSCIYVWKTNTTMIGGTVIGNQKINQLGGAVYNRDSGTFTMKGGAFIYNRTTDSGGAFGINGGALVIEGGTISHNRAEKNGGAIAMWSNYANVTVNIKGGEITDNYAVGDGGALYAPRTSQNKKYTYLTISGGRIAGNHASNGGGVAAEINKVQFTMSGGVIEYNEGSGNTGGVLLLGNVVFNMTGGTIRHNAGLNFGGIGTSSATVALSGNVDISDNYSYPDGTSGKITKSGDEYTLDATDGVPSNIKTANANDRIKVTGQLQLAQKIGFTRSGNTGVFTTGWSTAMSDADPEDFFKSDSDDYIVIKNSGGEAEIIARPVATIKSDGNTTYYSDFSTALSAWTQGSTLKLMTDVTTSSTITVPSGEHTLDLNGYGVKMTGSDSVFTVRGGAKLIINDSNPDKEHRFSLSNAQSNGAGFATVNDSLTSGYQTFKGGYITGGKGNTRSSWREGGAIYIEGEVEMNAGTLIGNGTYGSSHGGGFETRESGRFVMNGGCIQNNAALCGGACRLVGGSAEFAGGKVINNVVSNDGGGIHVGGTIPLVLKDCEISGNYANGGPGAGVWMSNDGTTVSGKTVIKENYVGTREDNIEIPSNRVLYVGELTDGASIGITMQSGPAAFTSGWKDNMGDADPSKYFTSDNDTYVVLLSSNGELEISLPPVASIISGETTTNYSSISDAVNAWTAGSTLKLLTDVTTSSTITVPTGEHTLDLNGCGILMTGNDRVITINQGASLELNDSDPDRIHYITLTNYRGTAVSDSGEESVSNGNGVIKVTGGYLTGGYRNNSGSHDRCGAGVYNWGTFVMNGGSIVGNTLFNNSGGGIRNSGYFTINGGTIAFNYASGNGGGVTTYVPGGSQGKMTMNGGEISDNYCGSYGGGIQIAGPIEMTGGSVVRNTAGSGGSGVFYDGKNDRFKLSGNPVIKDNSNKDDLYLGANATFMINGSLTEEADIHVLMNTPAEFTVGWKNIMGNADPSKYFTSANSGYAVILNNNGEAEIAPPPVASIISGDVTTSYGSLSEAVNAWTADSTLKLLTDVTTSSTITVPSGEHTLDLNGFTITRTGATGADNSGLVMTVNNGVDLTVTGPGKITGGSGFHGGGIHVEGNSSLVLDNCEISGNTGHYGGGLYLSVGTITLKNGAAVKNNTATEGFGGSGIYAEGGGTLILEDATFTENAIRNGNQHAVFLAGNANIKVIGAPVIYDNTYNGEQKNLYLYQAADQHSYVMPAGALTDGAKIGVGQTTGAGVFTVGWPTYMSDPDSAAYFISSVANYDVLMNQDGELEIAYPLVPDVSAEGFAGDYDGAGHSITVSAPNGAEVKYGTQEGSFTLTDNPTFTDAGTYTVYYEASMEKHTSVYGSAVVQIDPIDVTVTVTGHNSTVDYDGKAQTVTGYDVVFSTPLYAEEYFTFSGTAKAERTDAGTTTMGLTAGQFANTGDNFANVTFNVTDGYITVNPIDVTVTITGHNSTVDYDGKAHTVTGYDAAFSTPLYVEEYFTFSGTAKAERTDAGTTTMGLTAGQFSNTNDNFAAVTFNVTDGYITIDPIDVTVTVTGHNSSVDYDGKAHSVSGYDVEFSTPLYTEADFTFSGEAKAERTIAGTSVMGLSADQFSNTNDNFANVTFDVTDGTISICAINVTVTVIGHSTTADYDGELHSISGYDAYATSDLYDVTKDFTFSGTAKAERTDAGTTEMGLSADQFDNTNTNFSGVTFIVTDGYVTIDPIDVTVTVTGHNNTADYDGKAHSIEGYDAVASSDLYDVTKDFSFSGTAKAERTDAGTAVMGLAADQFNNTNTNFATVTFEVTDGYLTVNPINVTVTVTGHNSTVNYDGESHTVIGYDVAFSTTLYTEDAFTFTGEAKVERTNAGTATMGLTAGQFANVSDNFAHVTFNVTDGYVTVNPINVTVSIIGHTGSAEYDGSAHSVIGYDVAFSTPLYTEADFTFSGTATAERTDAGTTAMGLEERQFENKSPNFAVVTFDIKDGSITVDPTDVTVTVTGHISTVDYDGEAHSVSGYDAVAGSDLYDVTKDFTFTGTAQATQTDAGTAAMQLRAEQFRNTNPNFSTVTFIITDGYITVDPIDVTVTIVGDSVTVDYDGNTHIAFEYTATADTELYNVEEDFTFISTAYADRADAGVTYMGMKPEHFENTNNNFADVTFIVTDGYVRIDPIDVTVTITGSSDTAVYDGKAHSIEGYDAVASSDLYDVTKDFSFSGTAKAERTDAGTTDMGLAPEQFGNINPNFADVTFIVTDGYQTVTRADAVITTAPYAKDKLVYTGSEQQLIMPGSVTGGTLYYALGANGSTAPAASRYSTKIPTASQIGNYYIWYKVVADTNHNSIAPAYLKITLAEPEWMTIKGTITFGDGSAAADDVTVTLMSGNTVVDTIDTDANGGYYFTVPAGIYNIVVTSGDVTQTVMVDITEGTVRDITLSEGNTKSVLDVVSSDKSIVVGGLDEEAASVRSSEGLSYDRSVTVKMTVATVSAGATTASVAISDYAQDRYLEYYDMKVEKTVDSVTTALSETQNVLEVAIPFSYTSKRDLAVYRCDGGDVQELTQSSTGAADTYRVDYEAGLVYIYSNRVQTYAISYKPYYRVNSLLTLGSFGGSVSVKLTKDTTGVTYELNNVSLQNISFTGVPKGTYTMTVTWKDGAENTLTLPFVIK